MSACALVNTFGGADVENAVVLGEQPIYTSSPRRSSPARERFSVRVVAWDWVPGD